MEPRAHHRMYIDGEWVDAVSRFEIINPANEELVATVARGGVDHADRAVDAAARAHADAGTVKRLTLELGGKGPSIVLPDADVEAAVDGALFGCFLHAGQACESATRLLLPADRHDAFVERMITRAGAIRVGDPADPNTDLGPLVSAAQRDRVLDYIRVGRGEGATLAFGGRVPTISACRRACGGRISRRPSGSRTGSRPAACG